MGCNKFEHFLEENEGADIEKNKELKKHLEGCKDCKQYFLFNRILNSQKKVFERAPENLLFNVRQEIRNLQNCKRRPSVLNIFRPKIKPAIAFAVLLIAVGLYTSLKNSPIGVIDNLADKFNISKFKNIKTGDILYVAKHINVDLKLNNNAKLQLDSNTLLQFKAKDKISLSRGEIYLDVGSNEVEIKTPNALITVKNTKTKIHTTIKQQEGVYRANTSCVVLEGIAAIGNSDEKMLVTPGQEIVLAGNGKVQLKNTVPDSTLRKLASRINSASKNRIFTAMEQLCDCLYDKKYDVRGDQLHGNDIKENKFPVRIFWQTKMETQFGRGINETYCFFNAGSGNGSCVGISSGI